MKVYVYPADLAGCGYYRLIWPSATLQRQGHRDDIRLVHPDNNQKLSGGKNEDGQLVQVFAPDDADVIVFQRVSSATIVDAIKIMRTHGIAVVVDIDDDMHAIHNRHPAFHMFNPNTGGRVAEYNWEYAKQACEAASWVTVSTPALLRRYAPHGRGTVLYNCVPEVYHKIEQPKDLPYTIGWPGSLHSHPGDPDVCGPAMGRLQRAGHRFKIIGTPRGTKEAFMLDTEPVSPGPAPLGAYPHALARLSVGICPLADTRFNEGKSWLKMLELASVGVPVIASPRAEYRRLHARGVGLLADNPKTWYRHGLSLMESEARRVELAEAGRAAVRDLTIEANAWRWWEAWSEALAFERSQAAVGSVPDVA